MDAVDYYNSAIRKGRAQDFSGAVSDFTSAMYYDKNKKYVCRRCSQL